MAYQVFDHARVYTADASGSWAEAMSVEASDAESPMPTVLGAVARLLSLPLPTLVKLPAA